MFDTLFYIEREAFIFDSCWYCWMRKYFQNTNSRIKQNER